MFYTMGGIKLKVTVIGYGSNDEFFHPRPRLLVSIPKEATLDAAKGKIRKQLDSQVGDFNRSKATALKNYCENNTFGGKRKVGKVERFYVDKLRTSDGYDIDEDNTLEDLFGSKGGIECGIEAIVYLGLEDPPPPPPPPPPEPECCVIS